MKFVLIGDSPKNVTAIYKIIGNAASVGSPQSTAKAIMQQVFKGVDMKTLKIISLFTGAGGLDIGFEKAGFRVAVAVESDAACCMTLKANKPNLPVIAEPLEIVKTEAILKAGKLNPLEAALVIGGPPCQSFSIAGLRKGLDDDRGKLLFEFVRIVREALPIGFVLENVKGLANWDKGRALGLLLEEFSKPIVYDGKTYKYAVAKPEILNAAEYGVPQFRERLFIVGNREEKTFVYPPAKIADGKYSTVWGAIGDLPPPQSPSKNALKVAASIKGRREKHGY